MLLLAFAAFCVAIDRYGHTDYARPADAIVILGAHVNADGTPDDSLHARTAQAVRLYRRGLAPVIICTGAKGGDEPTSEAESAAWLARQLGVPERAIMLEAGSTSTYANAQNTAKICRAHGWTKVVVVSDPYHLWRARRDFRLFGLTTTYTSPALTCVRTKYLPLRVIWTAREGLLVLRDMVLHP